MRLLLLRFGFRAETSREPVPGEIWGELPHPGSYCSWAPQVAISSYHSRSTDRCSFSSGRKTNISGRNNPRNNKHYNLLHSKTLFWSPSIRKNCIFSCVFLHHGVLKMVSQKVVSLPKGATFGSKFEAVFCVDVRRNGQKIRNSSLICSPKNKWQRI